MTRLFLAGIALLAFPWLAPAQGLPGLKVPPGFEVTEWADASVANDIYCITFTPDGRLVVAGRGYIRLLDGTEKNRAGAAQSFAHPLADGAMGLLWDEGHLYATGGGGLRRFRDVDTGGLAKPSELLFPCKTGGEHDAHAIVRNRDGWFYLLCGNGVGIASKHATLPTSPVTAPIAGALVRFPPDFSGSEIVADGFRNPYGLDFNRAGELFTYDSDNERCVGLPWYEFTRAYHIVPGGNHGWMSPQRAETWRAPPYFEDIVPPLAHLDRGSPTGVVIYRDAQFPEEYRDGAFMLDWTFGRIWYLKLTPEGASYRTTPVRFLEATGEAGFAPTSAAVHPGTGDLFVSIGGRGTRGAIYRIRHPKGLTQLKQAREGMKMPPPPSLTWKQDEATDHVRLASSKNLHERRHALEHLTRHATKYTAQDLLAAVQENLTSDDRLIRQATARLVKKLPDEVQLQLTVSAKAPAVRLTLALAGLYVSALHDLPAEYAIAGLRMTQRWLGDIPGKTARGTAFEGYTLASRGRSLTLEQREALCKMLPTKDADLNREAARILALIEEDRPEARTAVLTCLKQSQTSADDLHYLLVLARLPGQFSPEQLKVIVDQLLGLDALQAKENQATDRHWPTRLAELHRTLAARNPDLNALMLASKEFGRPAHAIFTRAPGFERVTAARRFLERRKSKDFAWNGDLIGLLALLPVAEARPIARELWGEVGLDDALLSLLARNPEAADRSRLVEALALGRPNLVQQAAQALEKLGPSTNPDETLSLLLALRDVPPEKEHDALRARLNGVLRANTRQTRSTLAEWTAWLRETDPARARRLEQGGIDRAAWTARLEKIDWARGDAERGRLVYTKASCAACHSGAQALGPDLRGIAGRFSRDDLFTALVDPSKDVSARYRMTAYTTEEGKVYQGMVIYEATDSLILQTGPATTLRLDSPKIRDRRPVATSLMPAGLLDRLSDADIADLYAHLRGLK